MVSRTVATALLALTCIAQAAPPQPLKDILARNKAAPAAPLLKEEDFSRRSRVRDVKLSPDGAWAAFQETDGQNTSLNVINTVTQEKRTLLPTITRGAEVHWTPDSGMLFIDSGDAVSVLSLKDGASSRVAALDRKLGQVFQMVDITGRSALVEENDRAAKQYRLVRIGADGSRAVIFEGERKLNDFLLDAAGQPQFSVSLDSDYKQIVQRKRDGKWTEVARCKRLRACSLVAASVDANKLTMIVNHEDDRKALVEIDLGTQKARVIHTDPQALADLRGVSLSPARKALFAVYDMPRRRNYGLTPEAKKAAADIERRFPETNVTIAASESSPRWLLTERGARLNAERYWLYERSTGKVSEILQQQRALSEPIPEPQLAAKIALHYKASDGRLVHGYLSLPPGKDAATLPMLTMVHGGPWGSFDNGYTTLVQALVNRGVAVFQPNFRASTGYGDKYMLAPGSDFGNGRVQADIIDGVRWLLANGVGDRKRLAIMGDSFGGYSTLLALTHTPDLFQFGMATVPPTDFASTLQRAAAGREEVPFSVTLAEMGIRLEDPATLTTISAAAPAQHADKVSKPLLILAGGKDDKVDISAVTDYVARLQGAGKPVSLLVDADEGHNPRKPMTRQAYAYLIQQLLHKHLGAPAPAAPTAELSRYLEQNMKVNGAL
jgi:dipeptidyl aminopeptidase/acylaminoacyl peptidase